MSLQESEKECAAVAVAPRVSLVDIEAAIEQRIDCTGRDIANVVDEHENNHSSLYVLSICLVVMRNGFTVIGKSAPASEANFNAHLGRKLAYEDAVRQIWPLMGYALRDRLKAEASP